MRATSGRRRCSGVGAFGPLKSLLRSTICRKAAQTVENIVEPARITVSVALRVSVNVPGGQVAETPREDSQNLPVEAHRKEQKGRYRLRKNHEHRRIGLRRRIDCRSERVTLLAEDEAHELVHRVAVEPGGRNVCSATIQRGGKMTKSTLAVPGTGVGAVSTV